MSVNSPCFFLYSDDVGISDIGDIISPRQHDKHNTIWNDSPKL